LRVPKIWRLLPQDRTRAELLCRELRLSPVLAQLLVNRNIVSADGARQFLQTPLSSLHDPLLLPGVVIAAALLHEAVKERKSICVYGDYDVDGITGTTLLWRCLKLAGAEVDYYVPDRFEEGYGLNREALVKLKERGFGVVVTVDCGIASVAEARVAKELGLQLIITDHHEMKPELPDAAALVHPRLPGSTYPFRQLCGAGVAFKLAWAICQQFSQARKVTPAFRQFLMESMALVALGTVADVMPLQDENRVFVCHGLKSLQEGPTLGLRSLIEAAGLTDKKDLDAEHIGFTLAPRLNAAGRLGHARLAIELLGTSVETRAKELAHYLNEQNTQRQTVERRIFSEARAQAESLSDFANMPALVLASPDWHPGVIGIVASRLVERYARPVLMIAAKDDPCSGSGRSVEGFALHEGLAACSQYLLTHGGHAMAAGFKIRPRDIDAFRTDFCSAVAQRLNGRARQHTLLIDVEAPLSAMTMGLMKGLQGLHPFGVGNRRPVFLASNLQIVGDPRKIGQGERHLSFRVKQEGSGIFKAIAWNMAERMEELQSGRGKCCLVFTPKINEWQGFTNIDLEVQDMQPGPVADIVSSV
jgi:single-stranded-DNA-specific exonuclease